jgi:hypothetical protein
MSRHSLTAIALTILSLVGSRAAAQEASIFQDVQPAAATFVAANNVPVVAQQLIRPQFRPVSNPDRSPLLLSLYASTAITQALDVHSTLQALKMGATEANPLVANIVDNRGAFIATKMAVAAGTIFAARQIAKKNKAMAVVSLVAINSVYAYVVNHNYKVARRLR